jgi:hypothetical protein
MTLSIIAFTPVLLVFFGLIVLVQWRDLSVQHIKKIYLYTVSLISLVIVVVGAIMLINLGLKTWVFTKADSSDYYYPPRIACDQVKNPDGSTAAMAPECTDPNYEANQKKADDDRRAAQKQRDAAQAVAMILVGAPVFYYHWKLARQEA